jgi:hypothetical protein
LTYFQKLSKEREREQILWPFSSTSLNSLSNECDDHIS